MSTTDLLGMDLVACRELVAQIRDERIVIEREAATAARAVQTATWLGDDADEYRRTANTVTGVMVTELSELMEDFALRLELQIDEQALASMLPAAPGVVTPGTFGAILMQHSPASALGHGAWNSRGPHDGRFFHDTNDPNYRFLVTKATEKRDADLADMKMTIALMEAAGVHPVLIDQYRRDAEASADMIYQHDIGAREASIMELSAAQALPASTAALVWKEHASGDALDKLNSVGFPDYIPSDAPREVLAVKTKHGGPAPNDIEDLARTNQATRTTKEEDAYLASTYTVTQMKARNGEDVYILTVPPTEGGDIDTINMLGQQPGPNNWAANGQLALNQDTASKLAAQQALDAAGVPPGSKIMLQGFSQGGVVVGKLAEDPSFNGPGGYIVTDVVTYGAPVDSMVPAVTGTQIHAIQHGERPITKTYPNVGDVTLDPDPVSASTEGGVDSISALDFNQVRSTQVSRIELPGYQGDHLIDTLQKNHDLMPPDGATVTTGYVNSIHNLKNSDPGLIATQDRLEGTYLGPEVTVVKTTEVTIGMKPPGTPGSGGGGNAPQPDSPAVDPELITP